MAICVVPFKLDLKSAFSVLAGSHMLIMNYIYTTDVNRGFRASRSVRNFWLPLLIMLPAHLQRTIGRDL